MLAGAAVVAIAGGLPTPALAAPDYLREHFAYLPEPDRSSAAQAIANLMIFLGRKPKRDVAYGTALAADLSATLEELPSAFAEEYVIHIARNPWATETLAGYQARRQRQFLNQLRALTKVLISAPPALTELAIDGLGSKHVRAFLAAYVAAIKAETDPLPGVLDQDPFVPRDINYFDRSAYSGAMPYARPTSSDVDLKVLLATTLRKRFGGNVAEIKKAKAVHNDPLINSVVPDPRLRTSLALLYGTLGHHAIDVIKSGVYKAVYFGTTQNQNFDAQVLVFPNGDRHIVFDTRVQFEDPRLLAPLMAHETIHQDGFVNAREEMIGDVLTDLTYAQFIREDPTIAAQKTALAQTRNTFVAALLNTRDEDGRINLLHCRADNIFPGGDDDPINANYAAAYDLTGPATPGNAMLDSMLSLITRQPVTGASFSDETVQLLNAKVHDFLSPAQWLETAVALKMIVPLTLAGAPRLAAKAPASVGLQALRPAARAGLPPEAFRYDSRASRSLIPGAVIPRRAE